VEAAYQAGIVAMVAAGNDGRNNPAGTNGYGTITAPAVSGAVARLQTHSVGFLQPGVLPRIRRIFLVAAKLNVGAVATRSSG